MGLLISVERPGIPARAPTEARLMSSHGRPRSAGDRARAPGSWTYTSGPLMISAIRTVLVPSACATWGRAAKLMTMLSEPACREGSSLAVPLPTIGAGSTAALRRSEKIIRMPEAALETVAALATGSITLPAPQPPRPVAASAHPAATTLAPNRRRIRPAAPPGLIATGGQYRAARRRSTVPAPGWTGAPAGPLQALARRRPRELGDGGGEVERGGASALARRRPRELGDGGGEVERGGDDPLLLEGVGDRVSLAGGRPLGPPDVPELELRREDLPQPSGHVGAGTHVARLLLHPHQLAQPRVARDQGQQLALRERVEQLHPADRHLRALGPPLMPDQLVVELAAAQDQARDQLLLHAGLGQHRLKPAAGQLLQTAGGLGQAEQALGRENHQRPRLGHPRLPTQQVEVLRGGGGIGHPDVALGGQLQEPLDPGRGVLGTGPLIAMRQQQRQPRGLAPLGQPGDDELVDDHLGAVDEIAELRLPQDERLGCLLRVAVFEADAGHLRQRAVVQLHRRERAGQVLDRRVLLSGAGVVQHQVALAEGAALGVLAGEANRNPLGEQGGERELL